MHDLMRSTRFPLSPQQAGMQLLGHGVGRGSDGAIGVYALVLAGTTQNEHPCCERRQSPCIDIFVDPRSLSLPSHMTDCPPMASKVLLLAALAAHQLVAAEPVEGQSEPVTSRHLQFTTSQSLALAT